MPPKPFYWDDDEETEDDSEELDYDSDDEDDSEEFEFDYDGDDEDEDNDEDEEEDKFAKIERAFRKERANIRACEDLRELRRLRSDYRAEAASDAREAVRIRAHDLVEIIDDRITDLKARRMARRGR